MAVDIDLELGSVNHQGVSIEVLEQVDAGNVPGVKVLAPSDT